MVRNVSVVNLIVFNKLKVLTFNVNGLSAKNKRTQVFRYLRNQEIDIACIQETHFTKNKRKIFRNEWNAQIYFSDWRSNARGVAILFSRKIEPENVKVERDNEGRCLEVSCTIGTSSYRIVNIYAPNEDDPDFFCQNF